MMVRSWLAPGGLHIEPSQPRDADAVAKLHAQSFYRGWPREDIAAYIMDSDTPTLVACDSKRRVAGFAMLRLLGDDVELMTIAVEPKFRGKGVGAALLKACFEDLLMTPSKRMILEVAADNPAAIRLYQKLGFAKLSERQGYYARPDGKPATALVMARQLE
ncbi:MAG TPA: ribosomal protein S18-alanine N-acetyltransferase [Devosia sp.]|jgi:ribosomal-protein-alanine N-acetyltransferase|nr:ribosomal protein S18-alanine N-acetyltransferase [Devosia sp.]